MNTYADKMNVIEVAVSGVSILGDYSTTELNCQASVSIKLPAEVLDVAQAIPERLQKLKSKDGNFYNGGIVWKICSCNIKLADNKKGVSVVDRMANQATKVLYGAAILAVNKDEIINENNMEAFNYALTAYK